MKFIWKKWFKKIKKDKTKTKEIKRPRNSYDIYNQNETLTLQTDLDKDLIAYNSQNYDLNDESQSMKLIAESEEQKDQNDNIVKNNESEKKLKTFTSTVKINRNPKSKINKNSLIYFIYEKNDKNKNVSSWQVKKENGSKALKTCKTKEETIEFIKNNKSTKNKSVTCHIKNKNGKIEETIIIDPGK